ncbi:Isoaspartyl peptidase precursor [Anatilimnocola aggregata]|uniref:Isoaspartyl peptidase n=1 Tax=Anatilimnocola aggregata TaxID=2528021 RepID=A0A517YKM6_9BACT|nr:isoaspartyl peptidase/L-asparaginase [Anatilimnocola aggregata]QDU30770.1 Isoaspartyl peptidase precursor [Anatilimnocola aggregata]
MSKRGFDRQPNRSRRHWLQGSLAAIIGGSLVNAQGLGLAEEPAAKPGRVYALALHGGAGTEPDKMTAAERQAMEASLGQALDIGLAILAKHGTGLEAVEQVIRHLEDDPQFNAGRGACFNHVGKHELDASIMDGKTKACGAVAAVRTVRNPISLARLVMTKTRHVLLMGDGAEQFADEAQVERVANEWFSTDLQREKLARAKAREAERKESLEKKMGTVGCVALDVHGNLAAGTSTGGLTNKRWGRIGDSPIIGAGNYADNNTCAISCTGTGEEFIRHNVAHEISARVAYRGDTLAAAVDHLLKQVLKPDDGGLIAVSKSGEIVMDYTTDGMARAAGDSRGKREIKLGR